MDPDSWRLVADTLRDVAQISDESLAMLRPHMTVRRLDRGAYFLREGERATVAAVVLEGVLREYFIDDRGRELTRALSSERTLTGSLSDLLSQQPAEVNLQAVTPAAVAQVAWVELRGLVARVSEWSAFVLALTEHSYRQKAERERRLLSWSAAERYERLVAERGALLERVPLRHVASYLGVTPEHLSRLRAMAASGR